jgi:hypothetical protein
MTRQPALPDLGSDAAFEHALLAIAFHLLLADARPVSPARLAAALPGDPARVERTLVPLDRHGRLRWDPERGVTGSHGLPVTPPATSSSSSTCISGPGDVGLGADQLGVSHDGDQDP